MPSAFHTGGKWLTPTRRLAIYLRDDFRCVWCLMCLTACHPKDVTLDHVVPREQGGTHHSSNLVTSCKACNTARGALGISSYARRMAPNDALAIIRRVRNAQRRTPNVALARAILSGASPDPRPIVATARAKGRSLAPHGSASDLMRRGLLDASALGKRGAAITNAGHMQPVPF
jgi:ferredoxin